MRLNNLLLALPLLALTACGAGGVDEIQPPIITNPNLLVVHKTIATTPSNPGTEIHGEGIAENRPSSQCGNIARFNAYRDDTYIYFRIEEALGFCWTKDLYEVVIPEVRWRGVPGAVIFANNGDPAGGGNGQGVFNPQVGNPSTDQALTPTQFKDNPGDAWFWLRVPLSLFNFATDSLDANSVFNIQVLIQRPSNAPASPVVDFTGPVHVDLVKPS